jgi:hypothetical protein
VIYNRISVDFGLPKSFEPVGFSFDVYKDVGLVEKNSQTLYTHAY